MESVIFICPLFTVYIMLVKMNMNAGLHLSFNTYMQTCQFFTLRYIYSSQNTFKLTTNSTVLDFIGSINFQMVIESSFDELKGRAKYDVA